MNIEISVKDKSAIATWEPDFMHGDCHVFASMLNQDFGLPIAVMRQTEIVASNIETDIAHVFVLLPDGRALDIKGPRPINDIAADFGVVNPVVEQMDRRELEAFAVSPGDVLILARKAFAECFLVEEKPVHDISP